MNELLGQEASFFNLIFTHKFDSSEGAFFWNNFISPLNMASVF